MTVVPGKAVVTMLPNGQQLSPAAVDNTDWLKTAAIILVAVDHFGHFFMEDDRWWSVFGRLAAPTFFFLLGYAHTRTVPLRWIWIGVVLTLLNSWNAGWTWVDPNILLSFALIRLARPRVDALLQRYGWIAFVVLIAVLVAVLPITGRIVDYGSEGWLWALFGLCQRIYVDGRAATGIEAAQGASPTSPLFGSAGLLRLVACLTAVIVYIWQEQKEYAFPDVYFATFVVGICAWSVFLCLFQRGPSAVQPPGPLAGALRFMGRHTLEIYAIQLGGSELAVKLFPALGS